MAFIYPPGIFFIGFILKTVKNMFAFLYIFQIFVPFLVFFMVSKYHSQVFAFLLSIFSIIHFTNCVWWSPDWIIQPMILLCLYTMIRNLDTQKINNLELVLLGFFTGIVTIIKHNIGFSLLFTLIVFIFINTAIITWQNKLMEQKNVGQIMVYFLLTLFLSFGALFTLNNLHFDAFLYYVFFYLFLISFLLILTFKRFLIVNPKSFLRNFMLLLLSFSLLPVCTFIKFGSVYGFFQYFYSLFVMHRKFQYIWDFGIIGFARKYIHFMNKPITFENMFVNYQAGLEVLFLLMPLFVNAWIIFLIFQKNNRPHLKTLLLASTIGICGTFMFFPLEGVHNLLSKVIIHFILFFYSLRFSPPKLVNLLKLFFYILILPSLLFGFYTIVKYPVMKKDFRWSDLEEINRRLKLPVERNLVEELEKQVMIIKNSTKGCPYYVIDSSGGVLFTLCTFINNIYPQYYIEMREGILDAKVADAIIETISQLEFIVVNFADYENYINKRIRDPFFYEIFQFIVTNFKIYDVYKLPPTKLEFSSCSQICDFLVMRKI